MSRHALGLLLLLIVTALWGSTFAIVKSATEVLQPSALIAWRFGVAVLALLPVLIAVRARRAQAGTPSPASRRTFWHDGIVLGLLLVAGYATQTIGLQTTSANRAAFITGLNVVMVPLWLSVTGGARPGVRLWGAVVLAILGISLLSWEGGALVIGDLWALACAFSYAAYIVVLERAAPRHAPLPFTAVQVATVAAAGAAWMLLDSAGLPPAGAWAALIYLGVAATAVTTLFQTLGQRWVSATEAAIIYALEPVAAAVFSYFLLSELVGPRGFLGGAMVVLAMVLSQLPEKKPVPQGAAAD